MIEVPSLDITSMKQDVRPVGIRPSKARTVASGDCGDSNCPGFGDCDCPSDCDCQNDCACEPDPDK